MPLIHRPGRGRARRGRGFTLIELMITVAIIGILAAVALPAYEGSVLKGRRAQARTALLEAMQAQERYFTQMNTYKEILTAGDSTDIKMTSGDNPSSPAYKLKAIECGGAGSPTIKVCVQLVAIPQKADPEAANLTLHSTGKKGCSGTKSATPGFCWP